jgi:CheY-like chemotaxis protein
MQILIVEDNFKMRRMIRGVVAPWATQVFEAAGGAEALTAYRAFRPDWVLMDIRLTEGDGIEATRRICASDARAQVVMVTGFDDDDLRTAAKEAGACGYVMKENLLELRGILNPPPAIKQLTSQ